MIATQLHGLIMAPVFLVLGMAGWVLCIVGFEILWHAFKPQLTEFSKTTLCKAWWGGLLLISMLSSGLAGLLVNMLVALPLGVGHVDCVSRACTDNPVTVMQVVKNVPAALRSAWLRIRPFFK
jgi:hypothetical protein